MSENLLFNLEFPGPDGGKIPVRLSMDGVRALITQLLAMAAEQPMAPNLERALILDENPIPANGFSVEPLDGDPSGAHVSIGIGPTNLQFAISLPALMQAFDDLKQRTEPDPTSVHRPN